MSDNDGSSCPTFGGVPALGLGTYKNSDPAQCAESVRTALEAGYRHVDTAESYGNEVAVGDGIAASDVPRDDVFLATKVLHPEVTDDYSYDGVVSSVRGCLDRLGTDYVDLLYVHWPTHGYDPEETFSAFADLHDDGLFEHVGLSNYTPELIDEVREHASQDVLAVQVELHPLLQQDELRAYCDEHGITPVAYSPLGKQGVLDAPELEAVAEKHGVSTAQVCLAWFREKGVAAIPKATGRDHIEENWASLDLSLDDEDVARIDGIDREHRITDPDHAPW